MQHDHDPRKRHCRHLQQISSASTVFGRAQRVHSIYTVYITIIIQDTTPKTVALLRTAFRECTISLIKYTSSNQNISDSKKNEDICSSDFFFCVRILTRIEACENSIMHVFLFVPFSGCGHHFLSACVLFNRTCGEKCVCVCVCAPVFVCGGVS